MNGFTPVPGRSSRKRKALTPRELLVSDSSGDRRSKGTAATGEYTDITNPEITTSPKPTPRRNDIDISTEDTGPETAERGFAEPALPGSPTPSPPLVVIPRVRGPGRPRRLEKKEAGKLDIYKTLRFSPYREASRRRLHKVTRNQSKEPEPSPPC